MYIITFSVLPLDVSLLTVQPFAFLLNFVEQTSYKEKHLPVL